MSGISFRHCMTILAAGAAAMGLALPAAAASAAPAAPHPGTTVTVTVPAGSPWTDTYIHVDAGTYLNVRAWGTINVAGGNPAFENTPAGDGPSDPHCIASDSTPYGGNWNATGLPCWSLIGRIGTDGKPFEVGDKASILILRSGELYLGVNDQIGAFGDNSGAFTAKVETGPFPVDLSLDAGVTLSL